MVPASSPATPAFDPPRKFLRLMVAEVASLALFARVKIGFDAVVDVID